MDICECDSGFYGKNCSKTIDNCKISTNQEGHKKLTGMDPISYIWSYFSSTRSVKFSYQK